MSADIIKFPRKIKKKESPKQVARKKEKQLEKLIQKKSAEYVEWLVLNTINDFEDVDINHLNAKQDEFGKLLSLTETAIIGIIHFGLKREHPIHQIAINSVVYDENTEIIEKDIEV